MKEQNALQTSIDKKGKNKAAIVRSSKLDVMTRFLMKRKHPRKIALKFSLQFWFLVFNFTFNLMRLKISFNSLCCLVSCNNDTKFYHCNAFILDSIISNLVPNFVINKNKMSTVIS